MENWDAKAEKKKQLKKPPKKFTIYPIRQQDDYYVPPKQLIPPFDELVNQVAADETGAARYEISIGS